MAAVRWYYKAANTSIRFGELATSREYFQSAGVSLRDVLRNDRRLEVTVPRLPRGVSNPADIEVRRSRPLASALLHCSARSSRHPRPKWRTGPTDLPCFALTDSRRWVTSLSLCLCDDG